MPEIPRELILEAAQRRVAAKRKAEKMTAAREHLLDFIEYTKPQYRAGWFHRQICAIFEQFLADVVAGKRPRVILCAPPQHGKTECASRRFPVWAMGKHPNLRFICASYAATWADAISGDRLRIMSQPEYQDVFPDVTLTKQRAEEIGNSAGGFMLAAGVDCGITGRSSDIGIIDDPIKGYKEATSELTKEAIWNWYRTDFYTRLQSGAGVIVMMCMTGDTRVLRSDGNETLLRDIRPGDTIATFREGALSTSKVLNWVNHGPDRVFEIRTASGILVKANERHPFLVRVGEELQWLRLRDLRPGHEICRVNGASGRASSVLSRTATSQSPLEAIAPPITAKSDGPTAFEHPQTIPPLGERPASSIATASLPKNTTAYTRNKTDGAPSANNRRAKMSALIGAASCASITATIRAAFGRFFATTATSPSDTSRQPRPQKLSQLTCDFTLDRIEEIRQAGSEDVFDIEVAETENFIANGLVSHNTRWAEDDLVGRLLEEAKTEGEQWQVYNFPAVAEQDEEFRKKGDPLSPERFGADDLASMKRVQGSYAWSALYQGHPAPAEGLMLKRDYWKYYDPANLPRFELIVVSVDAAFKSTEDSDHVAVHTWGFVGARGYLLDRVCERMGYTATKAIAAAKCVDPRFRPHVLLVEDKANGPAVIEELHRALGGKVVVIGLNAAGGKLARAWPFSADLEAGNVLLPEGTPWAQEVVEYAAKFPTSPMDHDIDAMTQAFNWRRENMHGLFAYYEHETQALIAQQQGNLMAPLQKIQTSVETPACPNCASVAVRQTQLGPEGDRHFRCNQCAAQWSAGAASAPAPAQGGRSLTYLM